MVYIWLCPSLWLTKAICVPSGENVGLTLRDAAEFVTFAAVKPEIAGCTTKISVPDDTLLANAIFAVNRLSGGCGSLNPELPQPPSENTAPIAKLAAKNALAILIFML